MSSGGVEGEGAGSNRSSQGGAPNSGASIRSAKRRQSEFRRGAVVLTYLGVGEERKAVISRSECGGR